MKKSVAVETQETDSSIGTASLLKSIPGKMSNPEMETPPKVSVTFEEIPHQIKSVTDPPTQQLLHLCELMQELTNEQAHRRHEETASSRTVITSAGSASRGNVKCFG